MTPSYTNYLDQNSAKIKEAQDYISQVPTLRDQGVQKIKGEQDYAGKQSAVDAATKTLYETQRRLDALPQQAQQRTAGRNVTQGQLDRIISAESKPLAEQYRSAGLGREQAGQSLSLADKAIQDYLSQFNQDTNTKYKSLMDEAANYMNLYQAGASEADRQWQRQQAEFEKSLRQQEMAQQQNLAKQQMALQERLARLSMPQPSSVPSPVVEPTSQVDRIEIDDGGDPFGGYSVGAQKAVPFWQQVAQNAGNVTRSAGGLNPFGILAGGKSVWNDTLGRIIANR